MQMHQEAVLLIRIHGFEFLGREAAEALGLVVNGNAQVNNFAAFLPFFEVIPKVQFGHCYLL
jgi:hypothetical protein